MEIPVIYYRNSVKRSWTKWIFVPAVLMLLSRVIYCQNLENSTIPVIKEIQHINSSDTKPVRSLLEDAVSSNQPVFNVLNRIDHAKPVSVTMRPTHIPAGLMSQSSWTVHKTKPLTDQKLPDTSPIIGLPIALSRFKERDARNINHTGDLDINTKNKTSFSFSLHHEHSNAGIYIPMEKLLRVRRQTQRNPGGRVIMLQNMRPNASRNQTQSLQQSIMQLFQNNPQYNLTLPDSNHIARPSSSPRLSQRASQVVSASRPDSKPALQGLPDLSQIDLNLPLRASDKPVTQTNRTVTVHRTVSTSGEQVSPNTKHHTETRRLRQSSTGTASRPRANIHTLQGGSIRSGMLTPSQRTPSSNLADGRESRQLIDGVPATRLTFVQPVTGRRITPTRTSSQSSSTRISARTPAVSSGSSKGSSRTSSRTPTVSSGSSRSTSRTSSRTSSRIPAASSGSSRSRAASRTPAISSGTSINSSRNLSRTPVVSSGASRGSSRTSSRTRIVSPGTSRGTASRTPVGVGSSRTITRISPGALRASSRTPARSSTIRRIASSVQRSSPTSRTGSSSVRTSRPAPVSASRSGIRSQSIRRPTPQSRIGTRLTSTARRTSPQQRRTVQPVRRRTPPDPFTQRFSAGFQRGSRLLHQPPIDFTSFSSNQRSTSTLARTPIGQGFLNSLALSNNLPFPGLGPGLPSGPPGLFLGGGFPTVV